MKSALAAAVAACALALPAAALADPAQDTVARYVAWRGGAAFEKATGLLVRGTTDNGRFQGAIERRIEPGMRIMSGSFTRQYFPARGDRLESRFAPFGAVRADFV